jgi:hypothetical protein
MADVAILVAAPAGTQRKSTQGEYWVDASVNDILANDDEVRNTLGNAYTVRIYTGCSISFGELAQVELQGFSGTVKYMDSSSAWVTVTSNGNYSAMVVGADEGGGVSVVCARKGKIKSIPFPVNP